MHVTDKVTFRCLRGGRDRSSALQLQAQHGLLFFWKLVALAPRPSLHVKPGGMPDGAPWRSIVGILRGAQNPEASGRPSGGGECDLDASPRGERKPWGRPQEELSRCSSRLSVASSRTNAVEFGLCRAFSVHCPGADECRSAATPRTCAALASRGQAASARLFLTLCNRSAARSCGCVCRGGGGLPDGRCRSHRFQ